MRRRARRPQDPIILYQGLERKTARIHQPEDGLFFYMNKVKKV